MLGAGAASEIARAVRERRAGAALVAERESYLPEIRVGYTMGAYDAEFFPSAFKRNQLAVGVTIPVWDAGQRELALARARADRNTAAAERKDRERGAAEIMTAAYHGYETSRAGVALGRRYGVELPIIQKVSEVLFEGKPARDAVPELMGRELKAEQWR